MLSNSRLFGRSGNTGKNIRDSYAPGPTNRLWTRSSQNNTHYLLVMMSGKPISYVAHGTRKEVEAAYTRFSAYSRIADHNPNITLSVSRGNRKTPMGLEEHEILEHFAAAEDEQVKQLEAAGKWWVIATLRGNAELESPTSTMPHCRIGPLSTKDARATLLGLDGWSLMTRRPPYGMPEAVVAPQLLAAQWNWGDSSSAMPLTLVRSNHSSFSEAIEEGEPGGDSG